MVLQLAHAYCHVYEDIEALRYFIHAFEEGTTGIQQSACHASGSTNSDTLTLVCAGCVVLVSMSPARKLLARSLVFHLLDKSMIATAEQSYQIEYVYGVP